jgi:hypothetical protein
MKKIFLLILFFTLGLSNLLMLRAQNCTPKRDACTINQGGTVPACFAPENPPPAQKGQPYELDMSFVIARTVKQGPLEFAVWRVEIIDIAGLPPGLNYTLNSGNPADAGTKSMTYPPDTKRDMPMGIYGCAKIKGTPMQATSDTHKIQVKTYVYIKGMNAQGEPTGNEIKVTNAIAPGFEPAIFNYPLIVKESVSRGKQLTETLIKYKIYPNPAQNEATLSYELQEISRVSVEITDLTGKTVWKNETQSQTPGAHSLKIPMEQLPEGLYLARLNLGNQSITQKIIRAL